MLKVKRPKRTTPNEAREFLKGLAAIHKIKFIEDGECGFCRPCVGLMEGDTWIAYNPVERFFDEEAGYESYRAIEKVNDDLLHPRHYDVPDAYHKQECFVVLYDHERGEARDVAVLQLYRWITGILKHGKMQITPYETGAKGISALIHGVVSTCFTLVKNE